jgi:outer membrane receptor protein involved in Fe transport
VGVGFASFLLGEVQSASQAVGGDLFGRRNYLALYAQDDFRVTDRLTLNLGLRWETTGPWTEKEGRWANFDTSMTNPVRGVPGVLVFADDGSTTFEGKRDWTQFGPRMGLAYQVTPRTVFRSAYSLFYMPVGMNFWSGVPYGFAPGYTGTNTVTRRAQGIPAFNWDNGYPGQFVPGTRNPDSIDWGLVSINPNSLRAGRIHQWNAGTDFEIARDLVLGVNYLGNRGTRLQSGDLERNQPDPEALRRLLQAGREWDWVSDPASAAAAGVPYPHAGFENFAFFALMPYVQAAEGWGPLFFVGSPLGSKDYHALQLTLEKRMSRGVAANMAYTLSRARGNVASSFQERWSVGPLQDVTRLAEEARVIDPTDRTHILKGYVAWDLPFGQGRRFMSNASGWREALVSGWMVSTILRYESGRPLRILSRNSYTGWSTFGYPIYVNVDPNGNFDRQFKAGNFDQANPGAAGNRYFDPAAFSNPPYGELGQGPGQFAQLRGFGSAFEDFGIMKNVRFSHRVQAQIRFEMINVFNRRYFANPVTDIGSPLFGHVVSTTGQPRQGQLGVRFTW